MKMKVLCIEDTQFFKKNSEYIITDQLFLLRHKKIGGYNVQINKGEYFFFNKDRFSRHFKTLSQIRKEKLINLNVCNL